MPNSLIFAVILAVWAAYLIQHWIRRRDHVATARSVDRFSEAMRVLERRQSMPRADLSVPAPRSYSVSLTRPAHPNVVVKRAQHAVASAARGATRPPARRVARRSGGPTTRPVAPPTSPKFRRPSTPALRGSALFLGVAALLLGMTAWALGAAPWWAAALGVTCLLLAVTFVRFSVATQRRRASSPVRAHARPRAQRPVQHRSEQDRTGQDRTPAAQSVRRANSLTAQAESFGSAPVATAPARSALPYDGEAPVVTVAMAPLPELVVAQTSAPESQESGQELEVGTWVPVPVPPPTYTLKARAPRSQRPEAQEAVASRPVEELPFDGNALALDEEFEELPAVHLAL